MSYGRSYIGLTPVLFTFQDILGNPVANGTLKVSLSEDAVMPLPIGQFCAKNKVSVPLDSNGSVTLYLTANAVMNPSDTAYLLEVYDSRGGLIRKQQYVQQVGIGFGGGAFSSSIPAENYVQVNVSSANASGYGGFYGLPPKANFLIAAVQGVTPINVSDNRQNVWHSLSPVNCGFGEALQLFYSYNAVVDNDLSVIATASSSVTQVSLYVAGFAGIQSSSDPFVSQNSNSGSSISSLQTGSVSYDAGDLVFTTTNDLTFGTSIDSGFVLTLNADAFGSGGAFLVPLSSGSVNPTWSFPSPSTAAAVIACFRHA